MRIVLDINEDANPNAVGEWLRSQFFPGEGYGCYSNFNTSPAAAELSQEETKNYLRQAGWWSDEEDEDYLQPFGYVMHIHAEPVVMCYYWDGDGVLLFNLIEDNLCLINTDCKKDNYWEWVEK